jgi:hypothetical protein
MNSPQKVRLRRLNIRLSDQEWDKVHRLSSNTTCRSISEYARKVLLNHPVKVFYRNQSFDNFEEQMTRLIPLLETTNDTFDRLVEKLVPLKNIPELKEYISAILLHREIHMKIIGEIRVHIEKISDHATQNNAL